MNKEGGGQNFLGPRGVKYLNTGLSVYNEDGEKKRKRDLGRNRRREIKDGAKKEYELAFVTDIEYMEVSRPSPGPNSTLFGG
jgi:hypothetical protein